MKPVTIDNFFPEEEFEKIQEYVNSLAFRPEWKSNKESDTHGHWNHSFVNATADNLADVSDAIPITASLAWDHVKKVIFETGICSDPVLLRCYVNAHTFGVDGYFHMDSNRNDEWTVVVYICQDWNPDWAGETVFLDAEGNIELASLPKKNRAVVFLGKQPHAARGCSRIFTGVRKTLMFKFRARRSATFEKLSRFLVSVGARKPKHRNGTLHDHLVRTYQILETLKAPERVCLGAGLHSIYGTNIFNTATLDPRNHAEMIRKEFGDEAETLALLFSTIDRPKALEEAETDGEDVLIKVRDSDRLVRVSKATYFDLMLIEGANLIDQKALSEEKMPRVTRAMKTLKSLSEAPE